MVIHVDTNILLSMKWTSWRKENRLNERYYDGEMQKKEKKERKKKWDSHGWSLILSPSDGRQNDSKYIFVRWRDSN